MDMVEAARECWRRRRQEERRRRQEERERRRTRCRAYARECLRAMFIACAAQGLVVIACDICRLCYELGMCLCCSCLCQPFLFAWHCRRRSILEAGKHVVCCALQCLQFWTPLSLTVFLLWILYRPDRFHPRVDSAILTALDMTDTGALRYDLAADLSFRNSNSRLGIRYLDIGATAFYNGTKLGSAQNLLPTSFSQGPRNTTVLHPAFRGVVAVDVGVATELDKERAAGTVHVRVSVDLTLMYHAWFVEQVFFYRYDCWLWFSPPSEDAAPVVFQAHGAQCWHV
ncbi:hypothetical protein ACQJBY_041542 [Aegilops geniculata]